MTKRDFAVISKIFFVRENELAKPHERVESGESDSDKKKIVM